MVLKHQLSAEVGTGFRNRSATLKDTNARLAELGYNSLQDYFMESRAAATPDKCLEWEFATKDTGYGVIRVDGKLYLTHRLSLSMSLGRLLTKREVACHRCDNPICFNPHHLFVGSASDNMRDMTAKGRQKGFTKVPQRIRNTIRDMYCLGFCKPVIAEIFNVTENVVRDATRGVDIKKLEELSREYDSQQT